MKLNIIKLLAFVTSASAVSHQLVKNWCGHDKWVALTLNGTDVAPFILPGGQAYIANITGEGNTAIVANTAAIFTAAIPKLLLGTSTDGNILYWNLNNITGNPMDGTLFNVTSVGSSPDICQHANR
ncbi:hypothetical protein LTR37_019191 [Vermiconidia calcicola]|uniref:Uncharacterized protein n=1 Tax=Vermiconidia calcicola TaxID=1690605 RepID=A0ACC3MF62_9PEZI|nr:hypothetical protein LTR37_019191 [Vermiconidia calcicola]